MQHAKAFVAGFLATLIFHQGVFGLLHLAGWIASPPFNMTPTEPLAVPQVLSLAFWGGVWGIAIWLLIRRLRSAAYWLGAVVLGAIGPSLVALFVVFPLKGMAMAGGWSPGILIGALLLNGAWGLGLALFMRLFGERPAGG